METRISLDALIPRGHARAELSGGALDVRIDRAIHDIGYNIRRDRIASYLELPGRYRVPMRIDLRFSIDMPEALLLVGDGHVSFGSPWMENRRIEDILEPMGKPRRYDNHLTMGETTDISVLFNRKGMQICIGGEERFFSVKERYMKSPRPSGEEGVRVGITCTKRAELRIHSVSVTEYDEDMPIVRGAAAIPGVRGEEMPTEKPTFQTCIAALPETVREEIAKTEAHLKSLQHLKFRRTIEKHGNKITYVAADAGVSYALYLSGSVMHHSFQWYIVTNGRPETWHRKANSLEEVLGRLSERSPELAERVFFALNECIGCREHCLARTPYAFKGQKKTTCHGHVFLKMTASDFQDVRGFFAELDKMLAEP